MERFDTQDFVQGLAWTHQMLQQPPWWWEPSPSLCNAPHTAERENTIVITSSFAITKPEMVVITMLMVSTVCRVLQKLAWVSLNSTHGRLLQQHVSVVWQSQITSLVSVLSIYTASKSEQYSLEKFSFLFLIPYESLVLNLSL